MKEKKAAREERNQEKLANADWVMAEFYATWCPHCQRMKPVVEDRSGGSRCRPGNCPYGFLHHRSNAYIYPFKKRTTTLAAIRRTDFGKTGKSREGIQILKKY